jgi:hypothetical protein
VKIVITDNFGRESVADKLVAENVDKYWGKKMVDAMNEKLHGKLGESDNLNFFRLVEDDYKLWRGMEELV